ncbi:MAG: hypothetical protein IKR92_00535 [Alphaproteobacteria bacterium]|nr:hypothetical protein [Alphaproteobacteria bacterium]
MSEIEAGALCFRAIVEEKPQPVVVDGQTVYVTLRVRYYRKSAFSVNVPKSSRFFQSLLKCSPGDEMYVSYDGEDIASIKRNPKWKRLWLRLIW